jgi:hypothetical protein
MKRLKSCSCNRWRREFTAASKALVSSALMTRNARVLLEVGMVVDSVRRKKIQLEMYTEYMSIQINVRYKKL